MRALKALTVVMAVLIVAGGAVLATALVYKTTSKAGGPGVAASSAAPWNAALDEPQGTAVAGIAPAGGWLAVSLRGGGPDRVVMIDPRTGAVAGRLALAPR